MFLDGKLSPKRVGAILLISLALLYVLILQVQAPIRHTLSERYRTRGDAYFANLEYAEAQKQYNLALDYDPNNQAAKTALTMAEKAAVDLTAAKPFFQDHNVQKPLDLLKEAQKTYTNAKDAVAAGVAYYQAGQFVYAQYPLQQAVKLDPDYPEAWHYLGLTYTELAKTDPSYTAKANDCFQKQNALTPKYLPSK